MICLSFCWQGAFGCCKRTISNAKYQYDVPSSTETSYTVNGLNQYQAITTDGVAARLSYDGNGSLTSDGVWAYSYDVENRLVRAVNRGTSTTVSYQYGPKGRRLSSLGSAGRTDYMYDGDEPIADYDQNGTLLRRYVNGATVDERVIYLDYTRGPVPEAHYYHRDHQGSIIAMSTAAAHEKNSVQAIYSYDVYGVIPADETGGQPFRYTGRRYDAETGLYYYRARYYSAELGRFLQTDPIGYEDTNTRSRRESEANRQTSMAIPQTIPSITPIRRGCLIWAWVWMQLFLCKAA